MQREPNEWTPQMYARSVVETLKVPLLILDSELRLQFANRAFYQTFHLTPAEAEGCLLSELSGDSWDISELRRLLEQVLLGNTFFDDFVMDHSFPHIGRRTIFLSAHRLHDAGDSSQEQGGSDAALLLLTMEDVTLRQRATGEIQRMQHSETRYRRLFEAARDGILLLNVNTGHILDANPFMSELLGYSHEDLLDKELWQIGLFADREASRAAFEELQGKGFIRYEDLPLQTQSGERREVEFVSNVYRENGQAVIQCNIRDITERRRLEAALQSAFLRERRITDALQRPVRMEIPENAFPGITVATRYEPALDEALVGGDFCDAFALLDGHVAFAIADASGKGLSAAARTIQIRDVLRAFAREAQPSLVDVVTRLNHFVCDTRRFDMLDDPGESQFPDQGLERFTCLMLAFLDPKTGIGAVVSAGCEPPLILRIGGETETIFPSAGAYLPLGILREESYFATPLYLAPGDTLLLVTDGLTEARRGKVFLGLDGLGALARHALAAPTLRETGEAILQGARAFGVGMLRDDACLLLARRAT